MILAHEVGPGFIKIAEENGHKMGLIYGDDGIFSSYCTLCGTLIWLEYDDVSNIGEIQYPCSGGTKQIIYEGWA